MNSAEPIRKASNGHQLLVRLLKGETVYSLCSRHHRLSGSFSPATTCETLFGDVDAGGAHDFPSSIDALVNRANKRFGTLDDLVQKHTVLPIFLPFMGARNRQQLLTEFRAGHAERLHGLLGLGASSVPHGNPLRACPECMREDSEKRGVAHWHVVHQLPGVYRCVEHERPLLEFHMDREIQPRWILPMDLRRSSVFAPGIPLLPIKGEKAVLTVSMICTELFELRAEFSFNLERLRDVYLYQMDRVGWVDANCKIDYQAAARSFKQFASPWSSLATLGRLISTLDGCTGFLRRFARVKATHPRHPFNHALVIAWLFEDWRSFIVLYNSWTTGDRRSVSTRTENMTAVKDDCPQPAFSVRTAKFLQLVHSGSSLKDAADSIGARLWKPKTWAAKLSVGRSGKFVPKVCAELVELCQAGLQQTEIECCIKLKPGTVRAFFKLIPEMRHFWLESRKDSFKRIACQQWSAALEQSALTGQTARKLAPQAYKWLIIHYKAYIGEARAHAGYSAKHGRNVDWKARDLQYAQALLLAAKEFYLKNPGQKLFKKNLLSRILHIGPRLALRAENRMPRSVEAIRQAVEA